jgi:hypothetical protein
VASRKDKAMSAQLIARGTRSGTTETVTVSGRGLLRDAWRRICLVVEEMNYASRRVVERQAPWTVDEHWYKR